MTLNPTGMPRLIALASLLVGLFALGASILVEPNFARSMLALNGMVGFALLWVVSDAVDHLSKSKGLLEALLLRDHKAFERTRILEDILQEHRNGNQLIEFLDEQQRRRHDRVMEVLSSVASNDGFYPRR